uniref:Uncharacterized protein n=1 Tax=Arundo donax TaxID=35708 RepID=A0A0A9ENW4_ARUDO
MEEATKSLSPEFLISFFAETFLSADFVLFSAESALAGLEVLPTVFSFPSTLSSTSIFSGTSKMSFSAEASSVIFSNVWLKSSSSRKVSRIGIWR